MTSIQAYFRLNERQSNWLTEIVAGISTYLSLSYIFIVNPAILSQAGIDVSAVLFATAVASGITTVAMGVIARLPFAVAPGLEMNGFFAFVAVGALHLTWQQALGATFLSGLICMCLAFTPFFAKMVASIPPGLKSNIGVSVGVFVATTGLYLAKIVYFHNGITDFTKFTAASFSSHFAIVLYAGLITAVILGLEAFRFPAGMLISIIVGTVICKVFGISSHSPAHFSSEMFRAIGQTDLFSAALNPKFWQVLIVLVIITFFGALGKAIGLTAATNLQSAGKLERISEALLVNGGGASLGASLGTSSLIIYVESAVGIASGGRTGITALVVGILMLASLLFTPVVGVVPVEATAGVLLYVGYLLMPIKQLRKSTMTYDRFDGLVALVMGLISFVTFGLDKAMLFGFLAYSARNIMNKTESRNYFLLAFSALLLVSTTFQIWEGSGY